MQVNVFWSLNTFIMTVLVDLYRVMGAAMLVRRAGRYGQNLYHDIFLNFGRYDIIPISI